MAGQVLFLPYAEFANDLRIIAAQADLALDHYLDLLVNDPENFRGTCFYTEEIVNWGGARAYGGPLFINAGSQRGFFLKDHNLLNTAIDH